MRYAEPISLVNGLSLRKAALVTGVAYLLNPVLFAEAYAMPHLVASEAAQTVGNMAMHPHLFSAAVLSYFVGALMDLVIAWSLYVLLTPVNRALALLDLCCGLPLQRSGWPPFPIWVSSIGS
jgi:predicted membrane protein